MTERERERYECLIIVYNKCVYLSVTQTVIIAVNTVNEENQPVLFGCYLAFTCNQRVSLADDCAAVL